MKNCRSAALRIVTGLVLACGGLPASGALAADLDVIADHVAPGPGSIRFILFRGADGFRHEDRAFRVLHVPAGSPSSWVRFKDVPPGDYAVMAYHDANDDQKLDLRFGMFPKEGWGLSNNPKVIGPPSFAASHFAIADRSSSITIDMHY